MAHVFVEVYSISEEEAEVPVQSAVCLFLLTYLHCPDLTVTLVCVSAGAGARQPSLCVSVCDLQYSTADESSLQPPVFDCYLPVFTTDDATSCVAGLCAVLRQVIKHSGAEWRHLLGFREGCLFACAEVSLWTKFCEIDVVEVVKNILSSKHISDEVKIPENLARFEEHLNQPVRMHNVDKLRKEINGDCVKHNFAEGYSISLADLMIVPCVRVVLQALSSLDLAEMLPSVSRWYLLVIRQDHVTEALSIIKEIPSLVNDQSIKYVVPEVPKHSLYKSDPKRYRPKSKQFTRQDEVEAALRIVDDLDLPVNYDTAPFGHEITLDCHSIPQGIQPDVPKDRLTRKLHQLANLTKAVIKVAKDGDRIVDFCCGSGHLGIMVAYCLPRCQLVLLDNKEESLARAKVRVRRLGLTNVTTVQCNLDYFKGSFQIGISLHACGVASDLVIHSCLQRNAAFVVCPCCYGSLQKNHVVSYPRSSVLAPLSHRYYLVLGHCADQTHQQLYDKSAQGERCMAIVDYDRCQLARQHGYTVSLAKLLPPSCSPKNNLLVGIPHLTS